MFKVYGLLMKASDGHFWVDAICHTDFGQNVTIFKHVT